MKKLENIPKTTIFETPEGYFDQLPGVIQSRIAEKIAVRDRSTYFIWALQYALPAILLIASSIFVYQNYFAKPVDAESILSSVSSQDLADYLVNGDFSMDELLEGIEVNEINADDLNQFDLGLNETDLSDEFENEQL